MRQNTRMKENLRVVFIVLWYIAVGVAFASGVAVLISWGDYTEYFFAALGMLAVSTAGILVTSL